MHRPSSIHLLLALALPLRLAALTIVPEVSVGLETLPEERRPQLESLADQGYCSALAGIALPNETSVAFHASLGFQLAGTFRRAGFKLGAWHDIAWWQKSLRREPEEGLAPPADPPRRS